MRCLAQFLAATGRQLRNLDKVICHFFRKGKLGFKLAIKIPFFVEIDLSFESDGHQNPFARSISVAQLLSASNARHLPILAGSHAPFFPV